MSSIQIEPLTEMTSTVGLIASYLRLGKAGLEGGGQGGGWVKAGLEGGGGWGQWKGGLGWKEGEAKQGREVLTEAGKERKSCGKKGVGRGEGIR